MAHFEYYMLLGQSYTTAVDGSPALSTVAPYPGELLEVYRASAAPSPGQPVDLHENHNFDKQSNSERPSTALGKAIYESGVPRNVVLTTYGEGGTTIQELTNDGAADEHLTRFSDFVDWCVANSHTCEMLTLFYEQGERDQRVGTTPATYNTRQLALYNKINDGVQAIMTAASMSQGDIRMIQTQMDGWTEYPQEGLWPRIGLAQLSAHRTYSWFTLVGSRAHLLRNPADDLHLQNTSYRHLGEMCGRAEADADWEPAHPWSITRDGVFVSIRVHTRVWPLVFDTTHGLVTNYNLRYHDSADPSVTTTPSAHIVNVSLAGDTITLELNAVPTADPGYISHGWIDRTANIRDSDTFVSEYDAEPLANWLTHFYDPIGLDLPPPETLPDELPTPTDFVVEGYSGMLSWAWNGATPSPPGLPTPTGFGVTALSGGLTWYWDEIGVEPEPTFPPYRAELSHSTRVGTLSLASHPASMTRTSRQATMTRSDA